MGLLKIKGKYLYKSLCFLVIWVMIPIIAISTFLFIYHYEKVIRFIEVIIS